MEIIERKLHKKEVKNDAGKLGLGLLLYFIIEFIVVIIFDVVASLTFLKDATEAQIQSFSDNSATGLIIGVLYGLLFLFLFFNERKTRHQIFLKNKKMTIGWFAVLTCIFLGCQIFCQPVFTLIDKFFNLFGISALSSIEAATAGSTTVSMFIYCGFVAPIVEELIYRGIVLRHLSKYGKTFAIVASSVLFGVMHGNIPQAIFAIIVGLVLGYVATEYSIIWSIVLHILNNLVLGDLLYYALQNTNETVSNIIFYSIIGICFTVGLVAMIIKRKKIFAYIKENKWNMPYMRWTFFTVSLILFVLINLGLGIIVLEAI